MKLNSAKSDTFWAVLTVLTILIASIIYDLYCQPQILSHQVFGVSCMTLNNPFYEVINNELRKTVESRGDQLLILDPMLDAAKQEEQVDRLIGQHVDGIFLNPVSSTALKGCLERAGKAGIPIVVIDSPMIPDHGVSTTVVSDNWTAGQLCAQNMMETMDSARILLLEHAQAQSAVERIDGFLSAIEGKPQYQVVARKECSGQLEQAMPVTVEVLEADPDIDVIMALNDPSALGAWAAADLLGNTRVRIYGVDGTPDFKKKLLASAQLQATVAQSPYTIASLAASGMYDLLEGKSVPREQIVPVELLDRQNLDPVQTGGWQ